MNLTTYSTSSGSLTKQPRLRTRTVTSKGKEYQYFSVELGQLNGKRQRRNFRTEREALAFMASHNKRLKSIGQTSRDLEKVHLLEAADAVKLREEARKDNHPLASLTLSDAVKQALGISPADQVDAMTALAILNKSTSLEDAAKFYILHHDPKGGRKLVAEVTEEYIQDAIDGELRERSIKDMRFRLQKFCDVYGDRYISEITPAICIDWLNSVILQRGKKLSPLSREHYKTVVSGMFNFAAMREYVAENPFMHKTMRRGRRRKGDEKMPGVLSIQEITRLLEAAKLHAPEILPALAIQAFAGIRTAEIQLLQWNHIDLAEKRITVPPEIAKRRSVRHVTISDNLAAWLAPYSRQEGSIAPQETLWRLRFDTARTKAGIEKWPVNALRHSFASYHLVMHGDQNRTALELGHRDTDLLYRHYRGLVTHEEAEKYWSILPKHEANVVAFVAS